MSNPFDGLDPNNPHDVVTAAKKVGIEPDQLRQMMPSIDPYLGSDSESGMGIGDFQNLALTGAMQANKMVVDTASFLGNKIHPKASETLGLDSASQFFQRGIDAAEDLRSDRLKAEMSRPIYHEGTGELQMPSAIQATGLVTETLPMMPMFATAGRAATGALQVAGLGAGASTVGGYGATNAAFIGGDTYREAKDEITNDLSKKISADEFNGKPTVDDSIQRGEEIDLIAENYAQEAGNNMLLPGFVTGAVGLGVPALRTVDKPLSGVRARMGNAGLGAVTEGVSEFAEEAGQGMAVNNARMDAGNNEVELFDGVIDRGAKGLVGGAASGAAFGAMNSQAEWQRTVEPSQEDDIFVESESDTIAPDLNNTEQTAEPQVQTRDFEKEFSENVSDEEMEFVFQQAEATNPQAANDIAKDESLSDAEAFFKIKDLVKESGIPYLYDMNTDEMLEVATQLDRPLVEELALPARGNMSEREFRSNLANIIQQSDNYKQARNVFNQRIAQNNSTRTQSRQRMNEIKADSMRKRFKDAKRKGQFALARMQERSQQRQAEKQAGYDARKSEIENRVDRPASNFAGMANREQAVISESRKQQWVNKAADVKSSRKRFKKKLRQQQASNRVQLEMDRFYRKLESDSQAQKEEQSRIDWENTRLARSFRQAEEIGIGQEFNRIAQAVNQGIEQLPVQQREKEYAIAETALQEWVDEEYAGFDGNTGLEGNTGDSGAVADTNEEGSVGVAQLDQQPGPVNGEPNDTSATEPTIQPGQTGPMVDGRVGNDDAVTPKWKEKQARIDSIAKNYVGKLQGETGQEQVAQIMADGYSEMDAQGIATSANMMEMAEVSNNPRTKNNDNAINAKNPPESGFFTPEESQSDTDLTIEQVMDLGPALAGAGGNAGVGFGIGNMVAKQARDVADKIQTDMREGLTYKEALEKARKSDDFGTEQFEKAARQVYPNKASVIDAAANEAATSPTNDLPEPTQAQKEAGNYKKGKVRLHGLDISIENPKGSKRKGVDESGKAWETTMQHHYGDIKTTKGADGDAIDVFIGENTDSEKVFVVDQVNPDTGAFDEAKVMMGFDSVEDATKAYQSNYDKDWKGLGNITETNVDEFKQWIKKPRKSKQPFAPVQVADQKGQNETQNSPVTDESSVVVEPYKNAFLVKGDTKPIKDQLKEAGGSWNGKLKSWIFPKSKREAAQAIVDGASNTNEVSQEEQAPADQSLRQILFNSIRDGVAPKNAIELKKLIAEKRGQKFADVTLKDQKYVQEEFEGAMAQWASQLAAKWKDQVKEPLYRMNIKYEKQPNLNVKSATSVKNQAYSTPAPLSFLLNKAVGITNDTTVLEPTAGNGLLLITNNRDKTTVNEIDPKRVEQLKWLGYSNVQTKDATGPIVAEKSQDVVVMNPPFGFSANSKTFDSIDGMSYTMKDVDHIIAVEQLKAMKDDGRAFLILGANKEAGKVEGGKTGTFLNYLYKNYNVVDHVELDGNVYSRQGADWPIRVIQIDGRNQKASDGTYGPSNGSIERITGEKATNIIESLYDRYLEKGLLDPANRKPIGNGTSNAGVQSAKAPTNNTASNQPSTANQDPQSTSGVQPSESTSNSGSNRGPGTNRTSGQQNGTGQPSKTGSTGASKSTGPKQRKPVVAKPSEPYQPKRSKVDRSRIDTSQATQRLSKPAKSNTLQADYIPGSDGFNQDVLIPVNMAQRVSNAMSKFIEENGSIDGYVAEKLGYDSIEELHKSFMALQVDAAALAISKIEQGRGIIIADQTGVGKGRQAAAVIRYALQTGKTPVFITQKPNLFSDMYGDLMDIDTQGVNPFIMNTGEVIIHDGKIVGKQSPKDTKKGIETLNTGQLPENNNAVFLTYSQINKPSNKTSALKAIAENAIFVLDESHTGAGNESQVGEYLRELLKDAAGVTYLSATYAKRYDNLGLYHRTSLGDAADNMNELEEAIENGGLQLQTLLSSMLSEEGELIRRERSFEGISVNTVVDSNNREKHEELFNASTDILQDIIGLSRSFVGYAKKLTKEAKKNDGVAFIGNTTIEKDMSATSFTSVVHNYISQLTMAIKAESAAERAIESIKQGQKPVIALESTMESKLNDYMAQNNVSIGDEVGAFTFGDVFDTAINNALSLSRKLPNGETERVQISISELPIGMRNKIGDIRRKIESTSLLAEIPVSPIDFIRKKISDAGYSVSEITGRNKYIDYSDNMRIVNKPVEESKSNRRKIVDRFNNGKLDVLILNQSGSTGLSIHASEKFKDQKPRHMIVAQPSLDINTFMQMLGRINRTGQLEKPSYDLLWLDLPSENRPAAVLSNKMKQLNAQTSANTDSSTSVQSIDMFNAYGDQIVKDFLEENPEFEKMMGVTVPESDVAQYITGKLAVLPVAKQREFFEIVEPMYTDHVNHLKAIGEYSLETQEIDLQAEPIEQDILHRGGGKSIFDGDVRLTKVRVKKQGKPTSPDDLQEQYDNLDKDAARGIVESMEEKMSQFVERNFDKPIAGKKEELGKAVEEGANQESVDAINEDIANLNKQRTETLSQKGLVRSWLLTYAKVGSSVKIETDDSMLYGMITGVKYSPGKAGNPSAPSKFKFRVMTAGGSQNMTVSLVQLKKMGYDKVGTIGFPQLKNLFASEFNRPQFETRYIATGNIIKAFSMMQGRVITFTKKDGGKDIGMLLPTKFSPEKDVIQKTYVNSIEEGLRFLDRVSDKTLASRGIMDGEGFGFYQHDGELKVAIPINNATNRGKYLDEKVLEILGEEPTWRKGAKRTSADITPAQAKALFEHIAPAFTLSDTSAEEYNRINEIEELDSVVPNNQIRFNKANAESKTGGITAKAATLAFKRFMDHYKGLDDNGFEQIITDKKPSEIFGPSVAADDNYIKGAFDKGTNRMFIFAQNHKSIEDVRQTIREELLVHKGLGVFSQEEIGSLITRINDTRNSKSKKVREIWEDIAQNYGGIPPLHQAEEFLGKVAQKRPSFLDKYLNKVLAQVTKMLRKAGLVKQSITMSEMRSEIYRIGELLAKGKQPTNQSFDVQGAVDSGMRFNKSKPKPKAKQEVKQRLQNAMDLFGRKGMFKMLPINQMVDLYDNTFTKGHIKKYYDLLESFGAYKSKALSAIDEGAETRWDALQKENPKANTVMSRLMVNATMAQMSPDKSFSAQQIVIQTRETINSLKREENPSASQERYLQDLEVKLIELEGMYKQLADDWRYLERNEPRAVELYKEVRKAYIDKFNETKKALLDRIMELSADEQTKGQLISMVKLQFEKQLQKGDYFPLMRNGRFAVIARKGNEYIREHFEYPGEAREAEKRYKSQGFDVTRQTMADMDGNEPLQGYAMGVQVLNQIKEMRNENIGKDIQSELYEAQSFVEDMGELFKSVNNKIEADSLMDSIYQEMLKSLPNASAAKSFIHRNRTKGASNDSRRAFANSMFHSINRIAKIKYEHKFAKELDAIKGIADTTSGDDQHIVRDIHESLKERNNKTLNPDGGPVAAMLSGLGFNWLLGGSLAAGAVNLSQVPLVTFPYLSSKYGNRKASKAMMQAYGELRGAKVNIKKGKGIGGTAWRTLSQSDSLMDLSKSEKLSEQERELLYKLADDGKIDLTQMHAMAQIADTEMRDNHGFKLPFTNKTINKKSFVDVQRAWGFFFHNAEVVNRQVTALSTIRLAKENDSSLTADQLYDLAANAIDETQFNYASYNRGMWAREDFGKIALMFMTYTVNIITLMAKNSRRMFAGDKEARKFMVNMMGAHFLAAGAIGLPLVEAIGDVIFALKDAVDGDDEPDDFKKWMDETIRQSVALFGGDPNGDAAHMVSTISRKGIINGLTGVNIADRVGLNNLIWRSDNNPDATGSEMVSNMLMGVSPVFSIAANFLNGTQRMGQGIEQNDEELFLRGLQGFMPKAAGDVSKGFRQYNYGESTLTGTELIGPDQINAWNAITQSLGFSTEKVRDLYERRSRQYKYDKVIAAKRNTLVRKTANAVMNGENMDSLLADITKYNEQFPSQAITPDTIRRHILAKQRRDQQTINGIYTPKKRMGEVGSMQYYDN